MLLCVLGDPSSFPSLTGWVCALVMPQFWFGRRPRAVSAPMERKPMHTSLKEPQRVLVRYRDQGCRAGFRDHLPHYLHVADKYLWKSYMQRSGNNFFILATNWFVSVTDLIFQNIHLLMLSKFCVFFKFQSRVCCGFLKSWNLPQGYFAYAYCKTNPEGWTEITWRLSIISEMLHPGPTPMWVLSPVQHSQLSSECSPALSFPLPTALVDSPIQISSLLYSPAFVLDIGSA